MNPLRTCRHIVAGIIAVVWGFGLLLFFTGIRSGKEGFAQAVVNEAMRLGQSLPAILFSLVISIFGFEFFLKPSLQKIREKKATLRPIIALALKVEGLAVFAGFASYGFQKALHNADKDVLWKIILLSSLGAVFVILLVFVLITFFLRLKEKSGG